jgi:hypothetical protein
MTPELTALTLAALLQIGQFCAYSLTSIQQVGVKKAASPRDNPINLTGTAGRLQRAMNNHFEGLILFTIAVLVVTLSNQSTPSRPPAPMPTSARASPMSPPMFLAGPRGAARSGRWA